MTLKTVYPLFPLLTIAPTWAILISVIANISYNEKEKPTKKPKIKPAAKPRRALSATRFLEMSVQLAAPGLLGADKEFRQEIIHHLLDCHLREVLEAVAAIQKKPRKETAHA
jgi:hypothetical protein